MAVGDDDEEVKLPDEEEGEPGQLDDEGGDEAEAGQESPDAEAEEGEVEAKPSRATRRVQELRRVAQEASDRAARVEREIAELRAQRAQPQIQQETPEQEQAKLALMTTEERWEYKFNKAQQEHIRAMNLTRFQTADMTDRASYEAKASFDPRFKKYAKEVEDLLQQERRAGRDFPRETILRFVLGSKVMESSQSREAAAKAGKDRIRAQTTRPAEGRSDRAPPRERGATGNFVADFERRYGDKFI